MSLPRATGSLFLAFLALAMACAHILPPAWRAFPVDQTLAKPAVITALKKRRLPLLGGRPGDTELTTEWFLYGDGARKHRERFRVWWEQDRHEKKLVVYVRFEAQEEELAGLKRGWGNTYHSADEEQKLLDDIEKELRLLYDAMKTPTEAESAPPKADGQNEAPTSGDQP